jgi:general secretion pathway protein N
MKRWRWHILLFIVAYLVALVATLPAALAMRWAQPALAQLPQLQGVEGSIWSGRASQASHNGMALGELQWRLSPWRLLLGRIDVAVQLHHADGYLDGTLSRGFIDGRLRLSDVTGQLPAAMVKGFVPKLPIVPTGSFAVNMDEAEIDAAGLRALDGRIVWNKGGVAAPLALQLGDLVAEFSSVESGIAGTIKDSGGPLQLAAELKLGLDGNYTITGKSAARPGADPALGTSLSLLGQPDAQGMISFRFNGRL